MLKLTDETPSLDKQVVIKDSDGNEVSKSSSSLSHFLGNSGNSNVRNVTFAEASHGREPIMSILNDAGIMDMAVSDLLKLPKWEEIEALYGKEPMVLGLETCEAFRKRVPPEQRFIAVAGMFNSGTTAFGLSLQANCRFPEHQKDLTNGLVKDVNGMLNQPPWAKHKDARWIENSTIHPGIVKEYVLPVILIRDPYFWMHSMCKEGYGARWDHNSEKHCPNLVPNTYDRKRFKRLKDASSVSVWMGGSRRKGPSWPSLIHLWNDWYESYFNADFPRLIIRFEDTLYHGEQVLRQVCRCGGAEHNSKMSYVVNEAKWNHRASQNNMISAIIKYGTHSRRYDNMTDADLLFASAELNADLMEVFRYKQQKTETVQSPPQ